jgi:ketosteroid isomerase-like protein
VEVRRATWLGLLLVLVRTSAYAGAVDVEAERAALFRLDKAWAQAAAARDVEKSVSFWADDASLFPPGQPAVVGKDALRRYVSESFLIPGFSISWETREFVISAASDLAYGVGTNTVTMHDAQGNPVTERGRALTVWRKGKDNSWRCVIDIWNAEPAAQQASPPR